MKLALISDLHIPDRIPKARTDDVINTAFEKLEYIYCYCADNGIKTILQAGDFFNTPRSWSLVPEMMKFYHFWTSHKNINTFAVFGQHDTYLYSTQTRASTNLGILEKAGFIKILSEKNSINKKVHLHGVSWGDTIKPPVRLSKNETHILVAHAPVCDRELYPGHDYTPAKRLIKKMDYDVILVGDAHIAFNYHYKGRHIINTGPMMRLSADKDMLEHDPHFYIYDTETKAIEKTYIECAAESHKVLSSEHLKKEKRLSQVATDFISSLQKTGKNFSGNVRQKLEHFLTESKIDDAVKTCIFFIIEEDDLDEL